MSKSTDPFAAFLDGTTKIIARELAGLPVPEAWYARVDELYGICAGIERARKAEAVGA